MDPSSSSNFLYQQDGNQDIDIDNDIDDDEDDEWEDFALIESLFREAYPQHPPGSRGSRNMDRPSTLLASLGGSTEEEEEEGGGDSRTTTATTTDQRASLLLPETEERALLRELLGAGGGIAVASSSSAADASNNLEPLPISAAAGELLFGRPAYGQHNEYPNRHPRQQQQHRQYGQPPPGMPSTWSEIRGSGIYYDGNSAAAPPSPSLFDGTGGTEFFRASAAAAAAPPSGTTAGRPNPGRSEEEREREDHSKLVTEFTSLASRLGIRLPSSVMRAMMTAAEAEGDGSGKALVAEEQEEKSPSVRAMDETARAAIAYTETRERVAAAAGASTGGGVSAASSSSIASPPSSAKKRAAATGATDAGSAGSRDDDKPAAKRHRKPRLLECRERLTKLRTENEILKRHLNSVTSRASKNDEERRQNLDSMKKMMRDPNPDPETLQKVLADFVDCHADYGNRRAQELAFHLDQVHRLASPSQATKLGLWTVAHDPGTLKGKKPPMVEIMRKELGVSEQQDKRIFEQSASLKAVLKNLNEVRSTLYHQGVPMAIGALTHSARSFAFPPMLACDHSGIDLQNLSLISQLKKFIQEKHAFFHERMERFRRVLSPQQAIKCLVWEDTHAETLERLSNAWVTKRIEEECKKAL